MLYTMFHGKIHRAVVTQARLDSAGRKGADCE